MEKGELPPPPELLLVPRALPLSVLIPYPDLFNPLLLPDEAASIGSAWLQDKKRNQ